MDTTPNNFLKSLIEADLAAGRHTEVRTRFPPEPNGYLHIGHAKSICLNFGLPGIFGGRCHLRFDDTNPAKEEQEYVDSIQADVRWLGFDWGEHCYYASDYFERMYELGEKLIVDGNAYVCAQTEEEMRATRGTVEVDGTASPWRDRPVAESLDLFRRMRAGEFPDGSLTLRAKIDMTAANMKLRDPPLYRIRHASHQHVGDAWCIYPMYDYAHPISDAIEGITHSICTLEFENNRDLYDWAIAKTGVHVVHQYEFARLHLTYTVLSKRKLIQLVKEGHVAGWDDPRMPTIAGLRRRGVTPEAIRAFCERIGVAKANSVVDIDAFDVAIRDDLNSRAPRYMAVLRPIRVVIENWPGGVEWFDAPLWPHDVPHEGSRRVPFSGELLIDAEDFADDPPPKFHRLAPGREVRLRYAYVVKCVRSETVDGATTVFCTYDPATHGGNTPDGRKVPGTIHWVARDCAVPLETRLYDRLFAAERPDAEGDFKDHLNPGSLETLSAHAEPALASLSGGSHVQLERIGFFFADPVDSKAGAPVLNRVVGLKDSWAKAAQPVPVVRAPPVAPPPIRPAADPVDIAGADPFLSPILAEATVAGADLTHAARFLLNNRPTAPVAGAALARLLAHVAAGLSGKRAQELWPAVVAGADLDTLLAASTGPDDAAIAAAVSTALAAHPTELASYRAGKVALLGFFVGATMKALPGADARKVQVAVRAALG